MRCRPLTVMLLSIGCAAAVHKCAPQSTGETQVAAQPLKVDVVGCLSEQGGKFKLTDDDGIVYQLIGHTAALKNQIGDELDVTGLEERQPESPSEHPVPDIPLRVTKLETVLHMSPSGVPPVLGDIVTWSSYRDPNYGLHFRYPKTVEDSEDGRAEFNFADWEKGSAVHIKSLAIPQQIYPESNYYGGQLIAFVDPNIRSEGTCRQFSSFWPESTSTRTVHGVTCAQTVSTGVGAGHIISEYYFHTFQHDLCYELDFVFEGHNSTGMPLPCTNQWVSEENEFQLMDALLSEVRFLPPQITPAPAKRPSGIPTVVSFTHSPVIVDVMDIVEVSWATEHADYVQLHSQCVANVFVSEMARENMPCGAAVDRNFPANGTASLGLLNLNPEPIQMVITVVPFSDGRGYEGNSKAITIPVTTLPSQRKEK
jgi:hypothetical protein